MSTTARHLVNFFIKFAIIVSAALAFMYGIQALPSANLTDLNMPSFSNKIKIIDNVPVLCQGDNWPTGCESVSAVMALNYLGVDITVDDFIDYYLPMGTAPYMDDFGMTGSNPWKVFLGDPRSELGWGCYAPVIVEAVKNMDSSVTSQDYYEKSLNDLCTEFIDNNIPVLLWASLNMAEPFVTDTFTAFDGTYIEWNYPSHCLLLIGYDSLGYYFNDPMAGDFIHYSKEQTKTAYEAQGSQAVVIFK